MLNLVTAQSTAHEPPEDGRKYGPKHVAATSLKCCENAFKCFNPYPANVENMVSS